MPKKRNNTVLSPKCSLEGQKPGCVISVRRVICEVIYYILWTEKLSCSVYDVTLKVSHECLHQSQPYLFTCCSVTGRGGSQNTISLLTVGLIQSVRSSAASL